MKAEPGGRAGRQHDFAGRDAHPDQPSRGEMAGGHEQCASVERQVRRVHDRRRPESTVASKTLPRPTASRSQGRSGRLISSDNGPYATVRPCSSIKTCVASRTTSSKSCVTRISGTSQCAAQAVDLILQTSANGTIDGSERLVEQQHGGLACQRSRERDTLTFPARQFVWSFRRVASKVHEPPAAPRPWRVAPLADDARARSSRCREPSDVETTRTLGRRTLPPVDEAATKRRHRVSVHVSAPDCTVGMRRSGEAGDERRIVVLPLPDGPKIARTCTRVAAEFDVERNRTCWRRVTVRRCSGTRWSHPSRQHRRGHQRRRPR